jgi:hypothetical protein
LSTRLAGGDTIIVEFWNAECCTRENAGNRLEMESMPSWTDQAQAISSMAGVLVAIAGFLFVSYQIRQISRASRASAHAAIFAHSLELTHLMLDNPEVRPYLCDGKDLLKGDPLYSDVVLACEMFADFYEHVFLQRENLPKQSRTCWDKAITSRYQKNSALRKYIEEHESVYAPDFIASIKRAESPNISANREG